MVEGKKIEIQAAVGRPMLHWVGKQPLRYVTPFPSQKTEGYGQLEDHDWVDWPSDYAQEGMLFHGDNKEVLAHLLSHGFRGKVDLIYIDPPFDSGADYVRKIRLRGGKFDNKLDGEQLTLGEQTQYSDIWAHDGYLQFMYERLTLLGELLSDTGSIYVHMDWKRAHYVKLIMDEIFGQSSYVREIIWRIGWVSGYKSVANNWIRNHETLLFYSKDPSNMTFNKTYVPYPPDYERWGGRPSGQGLPIEDVWGVFPQEGVTSLQVVSFSSELTDYPTQKPEGLLNRIILASSNPGDIVLDCFLGSGTTAVAAQKLGRRWIGCDINKGAVQTSAKRLIETINAQREKQKQRSFSKDDDFPRQLSFSTYRVNDYDMQIQQSEALELAAQHVGVQRSKGDAFFDGTHGKKLAKIISFNHPLTLLDLEEIKRELEARPEEDRNITVVCLGKETSVDAWVEEWNNLRKKGDVPNKIDVIELRSDPKYGKFFVHTPATAKVSIKKSGEKIKVEIKNFISPSIIERLKEQAGLLDPKITDWRAMVDTVMIDPVYDGKVFNVALADVPEKKDDLISGSYEFEAPKKGKATVAVKITDMLGEEVLVIEEV